MVDIARKSNFQRNFVLAGVALVVLAGGLYGGKRLYRKFEPMRLASRARAFLEKGDETNANLTLRQALSLNGNDVASLTVMAELAEKHGDRIAVPVRRKIVNLQPKAASARIDCAETALRFGQPREAKSVLDYENPDAVARTAPRFEELAGRTASALHEANAAVEHFATALRASPKDESAQFHHAGALLDRGWIEDRTAARATLRRLSASAAFQVPALRALIQDSLANEELTPALADARALSQLAGADFPDRMTWLDLLRRTASADLAPELAKAEAAAGLDSQRIAALLIWLNRNGHAKQAIRWFDGLSHEVWADTRVCAAAALCSLTLKNWPLVEALAQGRWGNLEFVRLALLARAFRERGQPSESGRTWNSAILTAKTQPGAPTMLAKWVADWGWTDAEMEPLIVAAASDPRADNEFLKSLLPQLGKRRDTRTLWSAMGQLYTTDPDNDAAGNNFAMYSLLLRQDVRRATAIAEKLSRKHAGDGRFVSTYAYALLVGGEAKQALAALNALPAEQLSRPEVAAYYGLVLAAIHDRARAPHYLELAQKADLLPEEEKLVQQARISVK